MKNYYFSNYIMSLMLIISMTSTLTNGVTLVEETCKKISISEPNVKYDFCAASLGSDPRSSTADLPGLADISFDLSVSKAKSISKTIELLLKDPKYDPLQKAALSDCLQLYSDAPEVLETGRKYLKARDFVGANVNVSGAVDSANTCEGGFKEAKEVSPLTKENSEFIELTDIPLVFTNLLKNIG